MKKAIVMKSIDPNWIEWAVIYPYGRTTEWFESQEEAQGAADLFNGANI